MTTREQYERYITSAHWDARKSAYFNKFEKRCRACGSRNDMQLHHASYKRMGRELDADLVPLCQTCHSLVHQYHRDVGGSLVDATDHVVSRLVRRRKKSRRKPREARVGRSNPLDGALHVIRNRRV